MTNDLIEKMRTMAPYSSKREVAHALGVTYDWVRHNSKTHGIVFKGRSDVHTPSELKHFRKLVDKFNSVKLAAAHLKMCPKRLAGILKRDREKKSKAPVDTNRLKGLRIKAIHHAIRVGESEENAQDFGSYCVVEVMSTGRVVNVELIYNNWRYTDKGSLQNASGKLRLNESTQAIPISHCDVAVDEEGESVGHVESDDRGMRWHEVIELLSQRTEGLGIVARLIVLFGFSDSEVSMALGTDATAMCAEVRQAMIDR